MNPTTPINTQRLSHRFESFVLTLFLLLGLALVGCTPEATGDSDSGKSSSKTKLPKMDGHRPANFLAAVTRLNELFESINSDDPLPEDLTYTVVEVIHGTGAGAHSHFIKVEDGEDVSNYDFNEKEHVGESEEVRHEVSIDVFTEFEDIARWIPAIAADSEMSKSEWKAANQSSLDLQKLLKSLDDVDSPADMREVIRSKSKEIQTTLDAMQALSDSLQPKDGQPE